MSLRKVAGASAALIMSLQLLGGCKTREMVSQPKHRPLSESSVFPDGRASRPLIKNTVAQGDLRLDDFYYQGKLNGQMANRFPMPVTENLIRRGKERYDIYCSVCHGRTGEGNGMIVQRGFKRPPSFHEDRLRQSPPGYFVDVINSGFGVMYSYGDRVPADDRWAITAYIRALQRSRQGHLADVPASEREALKP